MLYIGTDLKKTSEKVMMCSERSRAVLICGKRGSGKSFTLGVVAEELVLKTNSLVIIIDPIGIYWSMCFPACENQSPSIGVRLLVAGDPAKRYSPQVLAKMADVGLTYQSIRVNPSDLSPDSWCDLFDLDINSPLGMALYRGVLETSKTNPKYGLSELMFAIGNCPTSNPSTIQALENRIDIARRWDIFNDPYQNTWDVLAPDKINVLDLSGIDPGTQGLRALIVSLLCRNLFAQRTEDRRKEALGVACQIPPVWLLMDEGHQFVPQGKKALSSEVLTRWVKEGRQPGLSLAIATQQPSALNSEVLSQCDVLIAHKLTSGDDIAAVNKLSQTYMQGDLGLYIKGVKRPGEVIFWDDQQEKVSLVKVRDRYTQHGGEDRAGLDDWSCYIADCLDAQKCLFLANQGQQVPSCQG